MFGYCLICYYPIVYSIECNRNRSFVAKLQTGRSFLHDKDTFWGKGDQTKKKSSFPVINIKYDASGKRQCAVRNLF